MEITICTKEDFDSILTQFNKFWDHDRTLALHHPTLIYEFGNSAFVIKEGDKVVAYLFGFLSQTHPVGYVHLLAVREGYRRRGLANKLYNYFMEYAAANGCKQLKAITSPLNSLSIAFHKSIGMMPMGSATGDEVPVLHDYSGPGKDRVVFMKDIVSKNSSKYINENKK
ncbi:MAG: GNAT family N-acetyltransferase [Dehalococcoidia bacterium]|jgi:predicted GNAT superfamily acetyltransferase